MWPRFFLESKASFCLCFCAERCHPLPRRCPPERGIHKKRGSPLGYLHESLCPESGRFRVSSSLQEYFQKDAAACGWKWCGPHRRCAACTAQIPFLIILSNTTSHITCPLNDQCTEYQNTLRHRFLPVSPVNGSHSLFPANSVKYKRACPHHRHTHEGSLRQISD